MFAWQEILHFWFGDLDEEGLPDKFHRERWFQPSRTFDWEIRRRFLSMVLVASEDGLENWREEPGGALTEILLLDQFTRNIHRGRAMAFDNDRAARLRCLEGLERGDDVCLPLIQRAFFIMPLQHSERLKDQEKGVGLYEQLVASANGRLKDVLQSFYMSSVAHRDIVARFGRFPHRNKVLGRHSTPEELTYIAEGGDRFGQ
ncbi:DUF924 family protein [Marinobacter nanhaiticus D15-8W]|uniref:DUF924 domain-containing protein n=1 Tax=Marinobacter nanhaiticus D15-8W TaxID=626887 RepID=N6WQH0_9GAMM|nr:DUF924 family protein [Marinobacter nanhaiticus]ENO13816.1 DUF924 domain-containing protein [Marinobacter nanhaiticus D15-8W]BES71190.1 DUF924 family protein [Marinobacter nanhaiticus D15-8W]